jgi:hypothetical protein
MSSEYERQIDEALTGISSALADLAKQRPEYVDDDEEDEEAVEAPADDDVDIPRKTKIDIEPRVKGEEDPEASERSEREQALVRHLQKRREDSNIDDLPEPPESTLRRAYYDKQGAIGEYSRYVYDKMGINIDQHRAKEAIDFYSRLSSAIRNAEALTQSSVSKSPVSSGGVPSDVFRQYHRLDFLDDEDVHHIHTILAQHSVRYDDEMEWSEMPAGPAGAYPVSSESDKHAAKEEVKDFIYERLQESGEDAEKYDRRIQSALKQIDIMTPIQAEEEDVDVTQLREEWDEQIDRFRDQATIQLKSISKEVNSVSPYLSYIDTFENYQRQSMPADREAHRYIQGAISSLPHASNNDQPIIRDVRATIKNELPFADDSFVDSIVRVLKSNDPNKVNHAQSSISRLYREYTGKVIPFQKLRRIMRNVKQRYAPRDAVVDSAFTYMFNDPAGGSPGERLVDWLRQNGYAEPDGTIILWNERVPGDQAFEMIQNKIDELYGASRDTQNLFDMFRKLSETAMEITSGDEPWMVKWRELYQSNPKQALSSMKDMLTKISSIKSGMSHIQEYNDFVTSYIENMQNQGMSNSFATGLTAAAGLDMGERITKSKPSDIKNYYESNVASIRDPHGRYEDDEDIEPEEKPEDAEETDLSSVRQQRNVLYRNKMDDISTAALMAVGYDIDEKGSITRENPDYDLLEKWAGAIDRTSARNVIQIAIEENDPKLLDWILGHIKDTHDIDKSEFEIFGINYADEMLSGLRAGLTVDELSRRIVFDKFSPNRYKRGSEQRSNLESVISDQFESKEEYYSDLRDAIREKILKTKQSSLTVPLNDIEVSPVDHAAANRQYINLRKSLRDTGAWKDKLSKYQDRHVSLEYKPSDIEAMDEESIRGLSKSVAKRFMINLYNQARNQLQNEFRPALQYAMQVPELAEILQSHGITQTSKFYPPKPTAERAMNQMRATTPPEHEPETNKSETKTSDDAKERLKGLLIRKFPETAEWFEEDPNLDPAIVAAEKGLL